MLVAVAALATGVSWGALHHGSRRQSIGLRGVYASTLSVAFSVMQVAFISAYRFTRPLRDVSVCVIPALDVVISVSIFYLLVIFAGLFILMVVRSRERQRLTYLQVELDRASRLATMGAMATTLAHELNQPLTAARNFMFVAKHRVSALPAAQEAADYIGKSDEQLKRAGDIIKKARGLVGSSGVLQEPVDVRSSLDRCLELLRADRQMHEPDVRIGFKVGDRRILSDPTQFGQVLVQHLAQRMAGTYTRAGIKDHH